MRPLLPLLLLALTVSSLLHAGALPLLEVWIEDAAAKQVALSEELMAYLSENGTLVVISDRGRSGVEVGEGRLLAGREVFFQKGDTLYLITPAGLERIMDCGGCSFYPYSRDRIAVVDSKGLLLLVNGERRRLSVKGTIRWSDDGRRLSMISGDELLVINASGSILWRKDLNTQLFDAEPDGLTYVCMKGCEVYAINDRSYVAWTNRLCRCCIPGRLDRSGDHLLVLIQGKELAVLNASDGRRVQSLELQGYEVDAIPGIVTVRDGDGRIHLLVDASRIRLKGESAGALFSWDVPRWLRFGELVLKHSRGSETVPVGIDSFVPIPGHGDTNVTLKGILGEASLKLVVRVKPLNATATPFGDVYVSGDGDLEIEVDGRRYAPPAQVDTGWLPTYSVRVYNHGVPVAELTSINARFLLLSLALLVGGILLWRLRSRSSNAEESPG